MNLQNNNIEIIELTPDRYLEYRKFKLDRLSEDPQSSHVTHDEEAKIPEELWKKDLEESKKNESFYHLFAQKGNLLVGMATVFYEKRVNRRHVVSYTSVHVHKDFRRQGIGKLLLTALEKKIMEKSHIIKAELTVNTIQTAAIKLYTSLGFKNVGTLSKTVQVNGVFYDEYLLEKFYTRDITD